MKDDKGWEEQHDLERPTHAYFNWDRQLKARNRQD